MTESREDKKRSKKGQYISYGLVLAFMIGFHYLSEKNTMYKEHHEEIAVSQKKSMYMMPQTAEILNDIYDINICGKYYQTDVLGDEIINSVSRYDGEKI